MSREPSSTSGEKQRSRGHERTYVGVDIIKSGGKALNKYVYAIALVKNGRVLKVDRGNLGRLVRYLWDYRPATLATDNILELGGSKRNLIRILKLVPPDTEFIQVTLEGQTLVNLRRVANIAGMELDKGKLNPAKTAVLVATLAWSGYGERLDVYERKVRINVFKGRSGHAGGSRAGKFQRNLRGAVARMVKKLREELERRGFDYDVTIRRSKGGVEQAVFTVYASREELFGVVKRVKGHDVEVRIKPVISRKFLKLIAPQETPKKYLIVGYDPGMQVGLAVIDLDMKPHLITSGRELDRGEILSKLTNIGIPVIVATDKNPPPEMVRKLAAMLNAQLFVPLRSLSTSEKEILVSEYSRLHGVGVKNTHERDALSAALKAYRFYQDKLEKLVKKIKSMGLSVKNLQKYKVRILMNEPLSAIIEDIINDYIKPAEPSVTSLRRQVSLTLPHQAHEVSKYTEKIKELERRVDELLREREILKSKVKDSEARIRELEHSVQTLTESVNEKIARDRKVSELLTRLKNASQRIEELEHEVLSLKERLASVGKVLERVFAGELTLLPRYGVKYVVSDDKLNAVFVDDLRQMLSAGTVGSLASRKVVLPPGREKDSELLVKEYLIPATTAREVWDVSPSLVAVDSETLSRLRAAEEEVARIKEEMMRQRELTYADLEAILKEYRESRLSASLNTSKVKYFEGYVREHN